MALNIKDPETDRLVRELAAATGETITRAVERSVAERLDRVRGRSRARDLTEEIAEIAQRCASLPVVDDRAPDEILGYDQHGLPA
jgi:antitoxin VapB